MERTPDWKKYPLVVVGNAFEFFPFSHFRNVAELPSDLDSFVLLHLPPNDLLPATRALIDGGFPADQIVLVLHESLRTPSDIFCTGQLPIHPEDKAEDVRLRLQSCLDRQRLKKISCVLAKTQSPHAERAHLAHALACSYHLSPKRHEQTIALALASPLTIWPTEMNEALLAACADLAQAHFADPTQFRELFRERSAALPFRLRSELKATIEKILSTAWKGKSHAA